MRLVGQKTSKYTKTDPDDHGGKVLRWLAWVLCGIGVVIGIPLGLAFALNAASGLRLWIGCVIFFGLDALCIISCCLCGMYSMVEADVERAGRAYDDENTPGMPYGAGARVHPEVAASASQPEWVGGLPMNGSPKRKGTKSQAKTPKHKSRRGST